MKKPRFYLFSATIFLAIITMLAVLPSVSADKKKVIPRSKLEKWFSKYRIKCEKKMGPRTEECLDLMHNNKIDDYNKCFAAWKTERDKCLEPVNAGEYIGDKYEKVFKKVNAKALKNREKGFDKCDKDFGKCSIKCKKEKSDNKREACGTKCYKKFKDCPDKVIAKYKLKEIEIEGMKK